MKNNFPNFQHRRDIRLDIIPSTVENVQLCMSVVFRIMACRILNGRRRPCRRVVGSVLKTGFTIDNAQRMHNNRLSGLIIITNATMTTCVTHEGVKKLPMCVRLLLRNGPWLYPLPTIYY